MKANTKEIFYKVRRAYRAAHSTNPLESCRVRMETASALRAITGKWDLCDPIPIRHTFTFSKRNYNVRKWHVAAACTRFLKNI